MGSCRVTSRSGPGFHFGSLVFRSGLPPAQSTFARSEEAQLSRVPVDERRPREGDQALRARFARAQSVQAPRGRASAGGSEAFDCANDLDIRIVADQYGGIL